MGNARCTCGPDYFDNFCPLHGSKPSEEKWKELRSRPETNDYSHYDTESKTPAGLPLTVGVEGGQLVIRIGVDTLAFCFEISNENQPYDEKSGDFRRSWKVVDRRKFARGVGIGLQDEREDGSTPLTDVLDRACIRAIEDDMGIEEDGRIVTHEMMHPL